MTCRTSMTLSLHRAWSDDERRLHAVRYDPAKCLAALEQAWTYWHPEMRK